MQAEVVVRCMRAILAAGPHITPLAISGLLGCFDLDKLVPLLREHDDLPAHSNRSHQVTAAIHAYVACHDAII